MSGIVQEKLGTVKIHTHTNITKGQYVQMKCEYVQSFLKSCYVLLIKKFKFKSMIELLKAWNKERDASQITVQNANCLKSHKRMSFYIKQ